MELASRVFDIVTNPEHLTDGIKELLPESSREDERAYWRRAIRMAALCHDIGHLPFSHVAEKDLLPEGWNHERLTREFILSEEMEEIWESITPPLRSLDVVKLAIGPKKAPDLKYSDWEAVLAEIIVGDAFGVDRIDYLLRDAHHAGVAYGKFDHYRLIDTLRILPPPASGDKKEVSKEPSLGVERGGIYSAEALLLARYFMYSQVYFHPVRRIYDIHLKDFLLEWIQGGKLPTTTEEHLSITDNEVISALRAASADPTIPGHKHAEMIINRKHFKVLYELNPNDFKINSDAAVLIAEATEKKFGRDKTRFDSYTEKRELMDFPVLLRDGSVVSSLSLSQALGKLPIVTIDYVFIDPDPDIRDHAEKWLKKNKTDIIKPKGGEEL